VVAGAFAGEDAVGEEGVPAGEGGGDHLVEDVLLDADGGVGWRLDFGGGEVGGDGGATEYVVGDFDAASGEGEEGGVVGRNFFDGGALEDVLPVEVDRAGEALDAAIKGEIVGLAGGGEERLLVEDSAGSGGGGERGLGYEVGGEGERESGAGQAQGGGPDLVLHQI